MLQRLSKKILFDWLGFSENVTEVLPDKCVIALAPHTSNWDFVIGRLYTMAIGQSNLFLMKKEWFFWPLGPIFRKMGGIPVWRSKHSSMTENLANTAREADHFVLCITPEGTRSLNPEWKKGFYYIAQGAQIPILLYGVDYERKLIQCTKSLIPTGDIEKEMHDIKLYFKDFKGKKPELFTIGE